MKTNEKLAFLTEATLNKAVVLQISLHPHLLGGKVLKTVEIKACHTALMGVANKGTRAYVVLQIRCTVLEPEHLS